MIAAVKAVPTGVTLVEIGVCNCAMSRVPMGSSFGPVCTDITTPLVGSSVTVKVELDADASVEFDATLAVEGLPPLYGT
jgi:hypothetical protein